MTEIIKHRRALPPYVFDALTIIGEIGRDRLSVQDFRTHMDAKGWSRVDTSKALVALERRGWVILEGGVLHVSDAGHDAASGQGAKRAERPKLTKKPARSKKTRMPAGLF